MKTAKELLEDYLVDREKHFPYFSKIVINYQRFIGQSEVEYLMELYLNQTLKNAKL